MAEQLIGAGLRKKLWTDYNNKRNHVRRAFAGTWHGILHRLSIWWDLKPGLFVWQVLYLAALALGCFLTFRVAMFKPPPTATPTTLPATQPNVSVVSKVDGWLVAKAVYLLAGCGAVLYWYKRQVAAAVSPHEIERRRTVASLLKRINHQGALDVAKLGGQTEARLIEICTCIRRDVEEFLRIGERDVSVTLLEHVSGSGAHDGELKAIARDRPVDSGYFTSEPRPALAAFVYEPIRLGKTVCFHDLQSKVMRDYFGRINTGYRSVYCIPLARLGSPVAHGVLTIKLKRPYLLWPKRHGEMERRLSVFVEMVNLFLEREAV